MPRRNPTQCRRVNNKASHRRRHTTRGHRFMSKLKKYKWYDDLNSEMKKMDEERKSRLLSDSVQCTT